jgi:hypothetical protein
VFWNDNLFKKYLKETQFNHLQFRFKKYQKYSVRVSKITKKSFGSDNQPPLDYFHVCMRSVSYLCLYLNSYKTFHSSVSQLDGKKCLLCIFVSYDILVAQSKRLCYVLMFHSMKPMSNKACYTILLSRLEWNKALLNEFNSKFVWILNPKYEPSLWNVIAMSMI